MSISMNSEKTRDIKLFQAGVGVIASPQNPRFVTNEYLMAEGIVPKDWSLLNAQTSPQTFQSHIEYENGVTFLQTGNLVRIVENCNASFQSDYRVFDLANTYLEKLGDNIIGCGTDLDMWMPHDDPASWITDRLFSRDRSMFLQNITGVDADLSFEMDDRFEGGTLQISFGVARMNFPEVGTKSVVDIKGLIQFLYVDPGILIERIQQWQELHNSILDKLTLVFEEM